MGEKEILDMININRLIKCITVAIILTTVLICTNVYAQDGDIPKLKDMTDKANGFIEQGSENADGIDFKKVSNQFIGLGSILTTIGAGVMVAVVTYMGIKYLTSGPEAQAKLKTQLIGVVVSGFVIFGAYIIWKIVVQIAETF